MKLNRLIIKNDFMRNKVINLVLFLFMMFSACLAVLSVIIGVQTFTSISKLYETAQPPHFLQMHKGEINQEEIDAFMKDYESIVYWQTVTMVDVYGEDITVVNQKNIFNLSDFRLDIGLVKQNEEKDLLLNSKHEKVILQEGEIGIPVLLREQYEMEIGDYIILDSENINKKFVIKEFILDSQMNSTMCSSTRILISDKDFEAIEGLVGENEYLIEAYFKDSKEASGFQTVYENTGLAQNGQAITYSIIFLLSALTNIVIVFVLLLMSILLIIVSFVCVRFTIMAAMQEDISEIGTMKAIGLPFTDIRSLYLNKYKALAMGGTVTGYILAIVISGMFTKHISTTFGDIGISTLTLLWAFITAGLVFLFINHSCKRILKKIKKVTVVDALVSGKGFEKDRGRIKDGLHKSRTLSVNWLMALREVFHKFRNWFIIFAVVSIAVMMILIPSNLMNTFNSQDFITYMGSSVEDILIEVKNGEKLEKAYKNVKQVLENDNDLLEYYEYRRVLVKTIDAEGELINLHIDCGDNAGNKLRYLSGKAPTVEKEIAVSLLNAEAMGKETGDTIVLLVNGNELEHIISGIYQDVTSGGYTAKSAYDFEGLTAQKYTFLVNLNDNVDANKKSEEWSKIIGKGVKIDPMVEFINQTLGGVVRQLNTIVFVIFIISACLVMLITVLFLKFRLAKDLSEIAVLKAIGFTESDIKKQYMIKIGLVSILGIIVGIFLTDVLGEKVVNGALSIAGIGIKNVDLIKNPLIQYILCPLLLMTIILFSTWIILKSIKKYTIMSIINE